MIWGWLDAFFESRIGKLLTLLAWVVMWLACLGRLLATPTDLFTWVWLIFLVVGSIKMLREKPRTIPE